LIRENLSRRIAPVKTVAGQMTAVRLHGFGSEGALHVERVPLPRPSKNEAVVRVRAAGVNHLDLDIRAGRSRLPIRLPHILGMEVAGEIAEIGDAVRSFAEGDRVAVLYQSRCGTCSFCRAGEDSLCPDAQLIGVHRPGAYAEYISVPAELLVRLPPQVSFDDAASVQLSFGTALHALVARARLQPGETVLVSAAGSGVGSAAVQVAALVGARTVATVGSPEKARRARELGADLVVDYSSESIVDAVTAATGGVDVVLEHVGGMLFGKSLQCLRPGGRLVVVGAHAGEEVPLDLVRLFRNQWSLLGSRRATESELRRVFELLAAGAFRPVIHDELPLERAADAHRLLAERRQFGKVVLNP
jgi:NADPH:quinone reductase-like Zn-dependent oxidoreductase